MCRTCVSQLSSQLRQFSVEWITRLSVINGRIGNSQVSTELNLLLAALIQIFEYRHLIFLEDLKLLITLRQFIRSLFADVAIDDCVNRLVMVTGSLPPRLIDNW